MILQKVRNFAPNCSIRLSKVNRWQLVPKVDNSAKLKMVSRREVAKVMPQLGRARSSLLEETKKMRELMSKFSGGFFKLLS